MCATVSVCVQTEPKMSATIGSLVALLVVSSAVSAQSDVETQAAKFLERFDKEATERIYKYSLSSWAYNTNITKENSQNLVSLLSNGASGSSADVSTFLTTLLLDLAVTRRRRGRFGATSTIKCPASPRNLIYPRSRTQKLNCSSSPCKTRARAPYLQIKHIMYGRLSAEMSCSSSSSFLLIMYPCCIFWCCSWARSWVRWTPSTAQPLFASWTILIAARLWSQVWQQLPAASWQL